MRGRSNAEVAGPLRMLFTVGAAGTLSDGELLDRYREGRAEEAEQAFAALVDRHGAMVRHVCNAALGDHHDAADAFQATFLVLSRRSGSIRRLESVAPWLFGVARRVSAKAKVRAARRRRFERSGLDWDLDRHPAPDHDGQRPEDWAPLHEEIDRLPARYRDPIVLCHLEGLGHEQAAARLGCPLGTLRTRLTRGRARLRDRLARRGLAPASAPIAPAPLVSVPTVWVTDAARLAIAARGLSATGLAVPLALSTLRSMTMTAVFRSIAFGGATLIVLGAGLGGLAAYQGGDAPAPSNPTTAVPAVQQPETEPNPPEQAEAPRAEPGPLADVVYSRVEGETTVIMAQPDGTSVKKDQLVMELDTANLHDAIYDQQIAEQRVNADYQNAIRTREVAELDATLYREGTFPMEETIAQGEIRLAQAELELAQDRLKRQQRLSKSAMAPEEEVKEAQVTVLRAELNLIKAQTSLNVLKHYQYERQLRSLEAAVEMARAMEFVLQSSFKVEKEKGEKLRRMIERCKIYAPGDGVLHYPPGIEEEAAVFSGQLLFWIEPSPKPADR